MNPSSSSAFKYEEDEEDETELSVTRHFKDPIHNYIPISAKLARFIDTQQFQRLRLIKQLGTTSYVWPSASHTRFEHSLGVAYLARLMATHIQRSQPELNITDRDVDCVEIAGLCHDLGHGPWSHVWDNKFIPDALKDQTWKHEQGSEMMFDALIEENNVQISLEDQEFVKALIAGEHSRTPHEKLFLFDIVANKRNGLDVDKFDYIHRDSHMIGEPISLSLVRLVNSARVLDDQICYDIKDANHIYDICVARFKLHKTVYNHKTAKAIEHMIVDALLLADPYLKIAEHVLDPKKYVHLTDEIMSRIEASDKPELAPAQAIFNRIRTRQLYKCVDFKVVDWPMRDLFREHVTSQRIWEATKRLSTSIAGCATPTMNDVKAETESIGSTEPDTDTAGGLGLGLESTDVIVDWATMHYGLKDKNPVDNVRFYSKRRPKESMEAGPGEYSNLRPKHFAEELLRVYTKKPEYYGLVQAGYRAVLAELQAFMEEKHHHPAAEAFVADPTMTPATPPATEAPSTPTHSRNASFTLAPLPELSLGLEAEGSLGSVASASATTTAPMNTSSATMTMTATNSATKTPFINNKFTTVDTSFALDSPTRPRSSRRARGGGAGGASRGGGVGGASRGGVAGGGSRGGSGSGSGNSKKRSRDKEGDASPSAGVKKRR